MFFYKAFGAGLLCCFGNLISQLTTFAALHSQLQALVVEKNSCPSLSMLRMSHKQSAQRPHLILPKRYSLCYQLLTATLLQEGLSIQVSAEQLFHHIDIFAGCPT